MQKQLPIALTPEDWELISRISSEESIIIYSRLIAQRNLPSDQLLDLEHRQYLHQKEWKMIKDSITKLVGNMVRDNSFSAGAKVLLNGSPKLDEQALLQPRRIFCYSYNEEGASYTLDDYFHWLNFQGAYRGENRRIALSHQSENSQEGGNDYIEWAGDCWHFHENNGHSSRWYDNGEASSNYSDIILHNWLLKPWDAANVIRTSPDQLDKILRKKAELKPEEVEEALEDERLQNLEISDLCYSGVSVSLFNQLGLTSQEEIARALQEEWLFHFGKRPAVYLYESPAFIHDGLLFRRLQNEEISNNNPETYKNARLILPADGS